MGVAVARSERERRTGRDRGPRKPSLGLRRKESLGEGVRRMALGQLDLAIEALEGRAPGLSPEQRVHEARKALKRLRALLRLLEDELGEIAYARESAVVREAGGQLARVRDAEVLLSTLERLIERNAKKLGGRRGVKRLRRRLQSERDGAAQRALADGATRVGALNELRAMRIRVSAWRLAQGGAIEAIEPALARIYGTGRRRMRRAARAKGERARGRKLHEWRKRVKDLRYVAEMLERGDDGKRGRDRIAPNSTKHARKRAKGRDRERGLVGKLARAADDLGELLGEEHDLAVLAERVRREAEAGRAGGAPGRRSRKALLKAIARRRKRLRKRALRDGRRLYGRTPKKFVRRVRAATARGAVSRR